MTARHRQGRARAAARWLAGAALAAGVLTGCSSVRSNLGTADSGCYLVLPTASSAVHHSGRLLGVRLVGVDTLRLTAPEIYAVATGASGPRIRRVCLAAFRGQFEASNVAEPRGQTLGNLAIVVVEYPNSRLLGTVLIRRTPVHFGHTHLLST